MAKYRIFISYSHIDKDLAQHVVEHLRRLGVMPMWDKNIARGYHFHDQIKTFISYSHVFLPLVTEASQAAGWVHQEIGFALALNVPVMPLTVKSPPGEMMRELQAVMLDSQDADLAEVLSLAEIQQLVRKYGDPQLAHYQCAPETETRATLIAEYANEISGMRSFGSEASFGKVRQRAALTSFHIPNKPIENSVWKRHYGDQWRSTDQRRRLREERRALEQHAREAGCRLIICPKASRDENSPKAFASRLTELLSFLRSLPDDKVEIARGPRLTLGENTTIVGDWFSAQSIVGQGSGYRQTILTRHAPTVGEEVAEFDAYFLHCLDKRPWPRASSQRLGAIRYLEKMLDAI